MQKQKILLLNYPSNPVGTTFSTSELRKIARVARRYGILIVADEIYGELHFEGNHTSIAQYYPEGTIVSSGLSKWCGAGGWRLGTFTFPRDCRHLLDAMATIASESFSAVSAPVQYAAVTAFNGSNAILEYLSLSRSILKTTGHFVYQTLSNMGIEMPAPEGGFYLLPDFGLHREKLLKKGIKTSADLSEKLLEETGVALLPGTAFGRPAEEYTCRLSFVDFDGRKALEAAVNSKDQHLDTDFIRKYCPNIFEAVEAIQDWLD